MFREHLEALRNAAPLIHSITNYVTINDCANALLAVGARPIMADDPCEAAEITSRCDGLTLNLGTLHQHTVPAMLAAGKMAGQLGHPIVLDPVGAGASAFRTETALRILEEVPVTAIRGNISEIRALALGTGNSGGVDAAPMDQVTEENLPAAVTFAKHFASRTGAVVAITGHIDIVADATRAFAIRNGCPMLSRVTGTGCQLSCLMAAFLAANPTEPLTAAAAAVCTMGMAGEAAYLRMGPRDGTGSFRAYLHDGLSTLSGWALETGALFTTL